MALSISQLAVALGLTAGDLLELVQDNGGTLESRKVDLGTLKSWLQFKNNLSAGADPGVNDDSTAGYEAGSRWLNNAVSPKVWWICTDATAGAAVWDVLSLSEDELGSAALVNTGTGGGDVPLNSDLGSAAYSETSELPFFNWLKGHGRLSTVPSYAQAVGGTFENSAVLMTPYNGSSAQEAGKFIQNNDDFGGSGGAMTATTVDLINTMGRVGSDARYGVEFYIGQLTMGSGTAGPISLPGGTKYLLQICSSRMGAGLGNWSTVAMWLRAIDDDIYLLEGDGLFINGARVFGNYSLTPAEGWVFMRNYMSIPRGYTTNFPRMYAVAGDRLQYALPSKFPGRVDPGIYTGPLPAASEDGGL